MKMISIDDLIEYCDNERTAYKANNCGAACTALRRVAKFAKEYAVEAEPCTFCVYKPPSSCDGKPCTICPAHKRSTEPPKGE